MIRSRCTSANELPVRIKPPFDDFAKTVTARSISAASRTLSGVNSTPNDGATDWIAANWPIPAAMAASRMTATRVTPGAISLSSSNHFPLGAVFEQEEPGGVAAGPRHTVDVPGPDRVGNACEHDRHGASRLQQDAHGGGTTGQDDVRGERDQLSGVSAHAVGIASTPAGVDPHVAAVGPAQLLQPLHECRETGLTIHIVRGLANEHSDPPHLLGLLRARREWPRGCRAAEQCDELALPHSITSSARASKLSGTVSPRAFAVLRLITSSNRVGCTTGSSAGLAPLRICAV